MLPLEELFALDRPSCKGLLEVIALSGETLDSMIHHENPPKELLACRKPCI